MFNPQYGYQFAQQPYQMRQEQMPMYQQQNQQNGYVCRPVTSREEAVASPVDFMASATILPDLGHGKIYLKRFNQQTGASDFLEFTTQQEAFQQPYDPRGDIERINGKLDEFSRDLDELKKTAQKRKAASE